ncbi:hypothetical protein GOP47_0030188, partial [Adiantum capillus-veneris]
MGPKKTAKRRLQSSSPNSSRYVSMKLRSGSLPKVTFEQEASSRVMSLATPLTKRGRLQKRCIYVDDEAEVEEDSNNLNDVTEATGTNVEEQGEIPHEKDDSQEESSDSENEDNQRAKHKRQFGKKVPLGLMKDVLGQFYVKRRSVPPLVPLCRLVPHEAVRFASDSASWLVSTFDTAAYVETMGVFLVSLAGPSGSTMPVTTQNLEEWGPIWTQKHLDFERSLNKEWQDLKGRKFLVWDGNHRLKTWMKRIKDLYADSPEYHSCVRCQFIEVDKAKEGELLLALDTTNAISRAHLVWKDEFNTFISNETAKIKGKGLPEHETKKKIDAAIRDKLYCLTSSKIPSDRKKLEVEGPQLPSDFEDFYKSSLKSHIIEAFASLLNVVKSSDDQQKMPELDFSARRLLFRWFMYCKEEKILGSIPSVAKEWVDLKDENTMYSPTIQDRGITDWEASMCPWWIDYPIGVIPKQEKELRI